MRVLVGYASAYGSTKGIAKEIGDRLAKVGFGVDVRPIDEVDGVETYDAVVIGSAVHNGAWLPQANTFVRTHAVDLAARPVWLFSVSSVGDTNSFFGPKLTRFMRRIRKEPKEVAGFRQATAARDHRNFSGAIERRQWNAVGTAFLKAFGGAYGDHRDWQDIDAWADGIAEQLAAPPRTSQEFLGDNVGKEPSPGYGGEGADPESS